MSSFSSRDIGLAAGVAGSLAGGLIGWKLYQERQLLRTEVEEVYDYIIVGGGTAGCALANRLSEDPKVRVLLLEAGPPDVMHSKVQVPAAAIELQRSPVDWAFESDPCPNLLDRVSRWPRGKVLGGSSCLNWMLWVRGHPEDYNIMEQQMGATGWGYEALLPYFIRAEQFVGSLPNESIRGRKGQLHIERITKPNRYTDVWLQAAQQSGLPYNEDYNNGERMAGCTRSQVAIRKGRRVSSAVAYLHDSGALQRPNLTVRCGVQVTRVILEGASVPRAVAVEYQATGHPKSVKKYVLVQSEIILSAGTVQSPQILMLSGIGDPQHLAEVDIDCRVALPGVGKNLQDHLFVPIGIVASRPLTMDLRGTEKMVALIQYLLTSGGPASSQALEAMAFLTSSSVDQLDQPDYQPSKTDCPDLQMHFVCAGGHNELANENLNFPKDFMEGIESAVWTLPSLLHPKSVGSITLQSGDPFDAPRITPNYLDHPDDLETLVRGVRLARKIHNAPAFQDYRGYEILEAEIAEQHHPDSDAYVRELIRKRAVTIYHPVGTCKIGPSSDPLAVVNPQLRVYGCIGLRVADCSVYPKLVGANTYACAIIAGEKAADLIKASPPLPPAHPSLIKTPAKL